MRAEKIRESGIAGTWYPDDPALLKKDLSRYLDRARTPDLDGELIGLVVPHAGYIYSGGVAAWSYKLLLKNRFDRVLILAPSHRTSFGGASVYNLGGYRTPLGVVPLDHELIDDLYKNAGIIGYNPQADTGEHSLEIQLPFLQTVLGAFTLTPVIMGAQGSDFCLKLANAIAAACSSRRVLIVASSDLSHHYPYEKATLLDGVCLDRLNCFDPEGLAREVENHRTQACGAGPLIAMMLAARRLGADQCRVLKYANSGDVTGDRTGVVGYAAAAIYRSAKDAEAQGR
ncbi:MEMO1 family protein Sfum_1298 [Syntrophobacter sp. SbD1]|nr:MEMO1 family protein Sfum_1298 [Syntrophobacter sp. SbD1]